MIFDCAVLIGLGALLLYLIYALICMRISRRGMGNYLRNLEQKIIDEKTEKKESTDKQQQAPEWKFRGLSYFYSFSAAAN